MTPSLLKLTQSHEKLLTSDSSDELWLKVDIEAPARKKEKKRTPADIVLVIDCSGSMGRCTPQWQMTYEEEYEEIDPPYQPWTPSVPWSPRPHTAPFWNNPPTNIAIGQTSGTYTGVAPFPPVVKPRGRKKIKRFGYAPQHPSLLSPLDNALAAARDVLGRLSPEDRAAVVLYDDKVQVVHNLSHNHQEAISKLHHVQMGGMTALADALYTGIDLLSGAEKERAKLVFLLSDGQANVGDTDLDIIANRVSKAANKGIKVSTFGLGAHFNEFLMEGVSRAGKGTYRYLESPEAALEAFSGELEDLFSVTASDVSLDINPASGVQIKRILGLDAEGTNVSVGDIPARAKRTMLICLEVDTKGKAGEKPLCEVSVSWVGEGLKKAKSETLNAVVRTTRSEKQVSEGINAEVLAEVAALQAADAQVRAATYADAGDMASAGGVLTAAFSASSSMLAAAPHSDILRSKVGELETNMSSLSNYDSATAKSMRYQSYKTRNSRS